MSTLKRMVVRNREGLDGIAGIIDTTDLPDSYAEQGILFRLIASTPRYVHYEAQPAPAVPESWMPFVEPTV